MILPLVPREDPILRQAAAPVTEFDTPGLKALVQDMRETQQTLDGVGLAAPQVGVSLRVIVTNDMALANPEVISAGTRMVSAIEGCLSLPGVRVTVLRPRRIKVKAYDLDEGCEVIIDAKDMRARVLLHEIDHVNGILITDRVRKG